MKYLSVRDVEDALRKGNLSVIKDKNTPENQGRASVLVLAGTLNEIIRHTGTLEEQIKVVAGMRYSELQLMVNERPLTPAELAELPLLEQLSRAWSPTFDPLADLVEDEVAATEDKGWVWSDYAVLLGAVLALIAMAPIATAVFLGWVMMWRDTIGWPLR